MSTESADRLNGAANRVSDAATKVLAVVRILGALMIFMFVFQLALQWQILQLDDKLDKAANNTARNATSSEHVDERVAELKQFVDELKEVSPDEQQRDEAIGRAVSLVPIIVAILCEQTPNVPSCQGG